MGRAEIDWQHEGVLLALDALFVRGNAASPLAAGAIRHRRDCPRSDRRGIAALFAAMRHVMTERPDRQKWNCHILSTLWVDVGLRGRLSA
jgi:hypothetical protein